MGSLLSNLPRTLQYILHLIIQIYSPERLLDRLFFTFSPRVRLIVNSDIDKEAPTEGSQSIDQPHCLPASDNCRRLNAEERQQAVCRCFEA